MWAGSSVGRVVVRARAGTLLMRLILALRLTRLNDTTEERKYVGIDRIWV